MRYTRPSKNGGLYLPLVTVQVTGNIADTGGGTIFYPIVVPTANATLTITGSTVATVV